MAFKHLLMLLVASAMYHELDCNQSNEENILMLSNLKKLSGYKQNLNKRMQHAPFRWGKREHVTKPLSDDLENICLDLFNSTVKHEKQFESKLINDSNYQKLLLTCFKYTTMFLIQNQKQHETKPKSSSTESAESSSDEKEIEDLSHGEIAISFAKNKVSLKENANAHLLKRNNVPFRWG